LSSKCSTFLVSRNGVGGKGKGRRKGVAGRVWKESRK